MPNAKAIIADEMKTYMIQGEANIAVTFSGEASKMLSENEDLAYVVPSEGTNLWFDNIVIPKRLVTRKARMRLSIYVASGNRSEECSVCWLCNSK